MAEEGAILTRNLKGECVLRDFLGLSWERGEGSWEPLRQSPHYLLPDVHHPPAPAPAAAVSAILQGYPGGQPPVTDASAELHRLCGCLELLLQVTPPPPRPFPTPLSPGPGHQQGFRRYSRRATGRLSTLRVSKPFQTSNLTLGG